MSDNDTLEALDTILRIGAGWMLFDQDFFMSGLTAKEQIQKVHNHLSKQGERIKSYGREIHNPFHSK